MSGRGGGSTPKFNKFWIMLSTIPSTWVFLVSSIWCPVFDVQCSVLVSSVLPKKSVTDKNNFFVKYASLPRDARYCSLSCGTDKFSWVMLG